MENIQTLLERYGRINRFIGDYRRTSCDSACESTRFKDAQWALDRYMVKLAKVENTLEDMGMLDVGDRYTNRGDA